METKIILLPNGQQLEIEASEEFYQKLMLQYGLASVSDVSDKHIRMFFYDIIKSAIDKAEKELSVEEINLFNYQ